VYDEGTQGSGEELDMSRTRKKWAHTGKEELMGGGVEERGVHTSNEAHTSFWIYSCFLGLHL
jgi:hypothetical protein